jgi:hypothetical protein
MANFHLQTLLFLVFLIIASPLTSLALPTDEFTTGIGEVEITDLLAAASAYNNTSVSQLDPSNRNPSIG